jgi:hypothetical protein
MWQDKAVFQISPTAVMLFYLVEPPRVCNTIKIRVVEQELDVSPVSEISV